MVIQEEEYDDIKISGVTAGQVKQLFDNEVYKAPNSQSPAAGQALQTMSFHLREFKLVCNSFFF